MDKLDAILTELINRIISLELIVEESTLNTIGMSHEKAQSKLKEKFEQFIMSVNSKIAR